MSSAGDDAQSDGRNVRDLSFNMFALVLLIHLTLLVVGIAKVTALALECHDSRGEARRRRRRRAAQRRLAQRRLQCWGRRWLRRQAPAGAATPNPATRAGSGRLFR